MFVLMVLFFFTNMFALLELSVWPSNIVFFFKGYNTINTFWNPAVGKPEDVVQYMTLHDTVTMWYVFFKFGIERVLHELMT